MSRYVNIEPYDDCKIVLHKEDEGVRCRDLPTADVTDVKHGKWIYVDGDVGYNVYRCSKCGEVISLDEEKIYNYCPNCGAKMDGERKEEE
mgnify:CR=1 FL=1